VSQQERLTRSQLVLVEQLTVEMEETLFLHQSQPQVVVVVQED